MAKYYAITTSMKFEKTVLVPIDSVKDIEEAMEIVDKAVETSDIALFDEEAEFETKPSCYANSDGMYELSDKEANFYKILTGEEKEGI